MNEFSTTVRTYAPQEGISTPAEDLHAVTEFVTWLNATMGNPLANRTEIDPASPLARVIESAARICEAMAVRICEAMADDIAGKEEEPTPWD